MDALTLLKKDHDNIGAVLDKIAVCPVDDGRLDALARSVENALTIHAAIEERVFYPALRERAKAVEDRVDVFEAYTEHDIIKHVIALLRAEGRRDEAFQAELRVLAGSVKHHVKEEESKIFGLAKELLGKERLEELGTRMEHLKGELLENSVS